MSLNWKDAAIDKNVPHPKRRGRTRVVDLRLDSMEVGDSILLTSTNGNAMNSARKAAYLFVQEVHPDWKFSTVSLGPFQCRLYRIA